MANFIKINDLGKYSDFNALWTSHPEGGREGDWVTVNGTPYGWDKYTRNWAQMNVIPSGGDASAESVDGDLNVGGNLNVGGDADIAGTLTVGDIKIAGSEERFKGQSIVTSFVFARRASMPPTPVGGDFVNPQPEGNIWLDGIPQGEDPIWMSSRIFTSDRKAPQDNAWSTPALLKDNETTDFELSPASTDSVPEDPDTNPSIWFNPDTNHNVHWANMNWLAIATKRTDNEGHVVHGPWSIALIKGERGADGDTYEHVFYRTKKLSPQPIVSINQLSYQDDDYLPAVTNKSSCDGEGNTFTDDPKGVNDEYKYEWFLTRHKVNGRWQAYANNGTPALWATFSTDHDISISDDGYWVIDGVKTDKRAVGQDGAVATIKGRVDVYADDEAETGQTSLESYPISLEGDDAIETGDCWVVENGEDGDDQDVSGHLFLYIGGNNENWERDWQDLGEFKGEKGDPGEDGHSQYLYLAWAENVEFNPGNPQTFKSVTNFTVDPVVGQNYGWLGIRVSDEEIADMDQSSKANEYKWNYLAGRDGMDYEHVYIRTSVNVQPLIDADVVNSQGYQEPEFTPPVDNINSFTYVSGGSNNTIEDDEFTDDPGGVSERWPYEWQSRRDKVNGVWGMFTQPVLHRNWANDGADGESVPWVKTDKSVIVIDTDKDGKINASGSGTQRYSVVCRLYYGETRLTPILQNCSATCTLATPSLAASAPNNPEYITVYVDLNVTTQLSTADLVITLANADQEHSASVTVPIVINRKGADGAPGQQGPSGPALRFRGAWDATTSYTYNSNFRDCVKHGSNFWVLTSQQEGTTAEPGTTGAPWTNMGNTPFVATELLLAESAFIELLAGNSIKLFNADGNKTAGINEDQHGSYVLYYPLSGKKMMEFSYTGYIIYYNNDAGNTVRWVLGSGGTIDQGTTWESLWWGYIGSSEPTTSAVKDYELIERFRYESNSAADIHNGKIYVTKDATSPSSQTIAAGYYTPNETPVSDGVYNKITVYHVSGGKVIGVGTISTNGNYTETPVSGDDGLNPFTPGVQPAQEQQQGGQS